MKKPASNRQHWTEPIIMKVEECLKKSELFPEEGADPSEEHASYWFNSFCENVEVQKESSQQDSPEKPDPVKRFLSYMAKRLLRIPCFDKVKKFAQYFDRCHTVDPSMVSDSPTVQAFCKLAAEDPKSNNDKPFDTHFLSQWPDRKLAFQSCPLYSDYKKTRDNERLVMVRSSSGMDNAMRLSIVKQLRAKKGSFPAAHHEHLQERTPSLHGAA